MIEVESIRIGNYYQYSDGKILEVTRAILQDQQFWADVYGQGVIDPIPLSEDWLKMFGFLRREVETNQDFSEIVYISPSFNNDYWFVVEIGQNPSSRHTVTIHYTPYGGPHAELSLQSTYDTYVHQLQNFFYSLSGKPLQREE